MDLAISTSAGWSLGVPHSAADINTGSCNIFKCVRNTMTSILKNYKVIIIEELPRVPPGISASQNFSKISEFFKNK